MLTPPPQIHISVHYTIANEQALHNFMEHHRVKVAQAGSEFHVCTRVHVRVCAFATV